LHVSGHEWQLIRSQIKHEHFCVTAVGKLNYLLFPHPNTITFAKQLAIQLNAPTRNMHIGMAVVSQSQRGMLVAVEKACIDACILANLKRTLLAIRRNDQTELAALFIITEMLLLITGSRTTYIGHNPDLQEVNRQRFAVIELTVSDPAARAHQLHIARFDDRPGTKGVFVLQGTFEHIGENLHVTVRVLAEAFASDHPVIVDDQKVRKSSLIGIVVVSE